MNDLPNLTVYPSKFHITVHVDEDKSNLMPAIDVTLSVDSRDGRKAVQVGYIDFIGREKDSNLRSYAIDSDYIVIDYNSKTKEVLGIEMLGPPSPSMDETDNFIDNCNDPAVVGAVSVGFTMWNAVDMVLSMIDSTNDEINRTISQLEEELEEDEEDDCE